MKRISIIAFFAAALAVTGGSAVATSPTHEVAGSVNGNGHGNTEAVKLRPIHVADIVNPAPDHNFGRSDNTAITSLSLDIGGIDLTGRTIGDPKTAIMFVAGLLAFGATRWYERLLGRRPS